VQVKRDGQSLFSRHLAVKKNLFLQGGFRCHKPFIRESRLFSTSLLFSLRRWGLNRATPALGHGLLEQILNLAIDAA
jgi:hypothetical protein